MQLCVEKIVCDVPENLIWFRKNCAQLLVSFSYHDCKLRRMSEFGLSNLEYRFWSQTHNTNIDVTRRSQFHQHFTLEYFCTKVLCAAFLYLHFGFVISWHKKGTCKMLMKFTTECIWQKAEIGNWQRIWDFPFNP